MDRRVESVPVEQMTLRQLLCGFLPVCHAIAAGTGTSLLGDAVPAAQTAVGLLQLVPLGANNSLLTGHAHLGRIVYVVVLAPGVLRSRLVIRERELEDGSILFQVSAPQSVEARLRRFTMYIKSPPGALLLRRTAGSWVEEPLSPISRGGLSSATISELGFLCLLRNREMGTSGYAALPAKFGDFDNRIRLVHGAWNVLLPLLVLATMLVISRRLHKTARGG